MSISASPTPRRFEPNHGPRFGDVRVGDDQIQARWNDGASAANEIRQAEEEWLQAICRDFEVSLRMRPLERPYSYDRGELATALAAFLKDRKLAPPLVDGVNNPFLSSLVNGTVENFGSHFQDNPNAQASIGDEQKRWGEFITFRGLFACPACNRTRFKRGGLTRPVCAGDKCETQFGFKATAAPAVTT